MNPIFILSLPRSGSTLLQRLLAAHSMVSSVAEPWLLLPVSAIAGEGGLQQYSEYSSRLATKAIREMILELPGELDQFHSAVREFCQSVYHGLCKPTDRYFVDKTPRYYLIADFIFEVFPDAKVIFLFRNPLDVLSSAVSTFSRSRFAIHHAHVDLMEGPHRLHAAHQRYGARALTVQYESLVTEPRASSVRLFDYLDLPFEEEVLATYRQVSFRGSMGDPSGDAKYASVDAGSIDRWKSVLTSLTRKRYARWYIRSLGADVLATFGVSYQELDKQVRRVRGSIAGAPSDLFWLAASWVSRTAALNVLRRQWQLGPGRLHKLD